jgi:hypothetical protein
LTWLRVRVVSGSPPISVPLFPAKKKAAEKEEDSDKDDGEGCAEATIAVSNVPPEIELARVSGIAAAGA